MMKFGLRMIDEEAPILSLKEFLICQEEDHVDASETHCSCNGSLNIHFLCRMVKEMYSTIVQ